MENFINEEPIPEKYVRKSLQQFRIEVLSKYGDFVTFLYVVLTFAGGHTVACCLNIFLFSALP